MIDVSEPSVEQNGCLNKQEKSVVQMQIVKPQTLISIKHCPFQASQMIKLEERDGEMDTCSFV